MITKTESVLDHGASRTEIYRGTLEVREAQLVHGIWLPTTAIGRTEQPTKRDGTQESTFDFHNWRIGDLVERDVEVTFPVGTHVVDSVKNVDYVINPNDTYELRPLVVSNEHVLLEPSKSTVSNLNNASQLYARKPLVLASEKQGPVATMSSVRILCSIGSLIVALIALAAYVRHKRHRPV
jgi:hypothetical protein